MQRKDYTKPEMRVMPTETASPILQNSRVTIRKPPYTDDDLAFLWDDDLDIWAE